MSAGSCWVKPRAPLRLQLQVGMRRQPRQLSAQNNTASRARERLIALLGRTGHKHLTLLEACPAKQRNAANLRSQRKVKRRLVAQPRGPRDRGCQPGILGTWSLSMLLRRHLRRRLILASHHQDPWLQIPVWVHHESDLHLRNLSRFR